MKIIAISGKKRTGKDSLCKALIKESNITAYRYAFADELKNQIASICRVSIDDIEREKEYYRPMLQFWGQHKRMTYGDDYWLKKVLSDILKLPDNCLVIITDLRMRNEYEALKEIGAYLVRITRPLSFNDTHISETDLDAVEFDFTVLNNSDLQHLHNEAKQIIKNVYST